MKNSDRYAIPGNENYEPGSSDTVLKNYLQITSKEKIEHIEAIELRRAELELAELVKQNQTLTARDICNFHELWLGDIYAFAGQYRTVNMSKSGFPFAAPTLIPTLMQTFEVDFLKRYTPCHEQEHDVLADVLGKTHAELIIIHPFREGNGRLARLLANLMALQANMPPLNYTSIDQTTNPEGFDRYIKAIHTAFAGDTHAIQQIFSKLLEDSIN
ncbi:MAG: cell filamentation protein [marine bacterium B5-7]|nr:MAG: cell filamentation protein [marine bacterium B5-7]